MSVQALPYLARPHKISVISTDYSASYARWFASDSLVSIFYRKDFYIAIFKRKPKYVLSQLVNLDGLIVENTRLVEESNRISDSGTVPEHTLVQNRFHDALLLHERQHLIQQRRLIREYFEDLTRSLLLEVSDVDIPSDNVETAAPEVQPHPNPRTAHSRVKLATAILRPT